MFDYVNQFGQQISNLWAQKGADPNIFPDLVLEYIDVGKLRYEDKELINTVLNDNYLSIQTPSLFSEYNCRIYSDERIYIELLHWNNLDTDLHNHNFTGVLFQIEGESIDVIYDFNMEKKYDDNIFFGEINIQQVDILKGARIDHQKIYMGHVYNHAVSHILRPTVSLIVRTQPIPNVNQNIFFPPSVCVNFELREQDRKFIRLFMYLFSVNKKQSLSFLELYTISLIESPNRLFSLLARLIDFWEYDDVVKTIHQVLKNQSKFFYTQVLAAIEGFYIYKKNLTYKKDLYDIDARLEYSFKALSYGSNILYEHIKKGYYDAK